jgi:hypothetical protein
MMDWLVLAGSVKFPVIQLTADWLACKKSVIGWMDAKAPHPHKWDLNMAFSTILFHFVFLNMLIQPTNDQLQSERNITQITNKKTSTWTKNSI